MPLFYLGGLVYIWHMTSGKHFTLDLINTIRKSGEEKTYSKRELILREGDVERHVYVVASGAVRISLMSGLEDQTIRLGYKGYVCWSRAVM